MAWPIDEASRIPLTAAQPVLFETGYGPSGLPHIGTFTEVARTIWVRRAFAELTGLPTRLIAFSDDMDGLRRTPENVPNKEMLDQHLGMPLTKVPDPFGTHPSFGHHNNAMLRSFLDRFGFEYEFASATEYYRNGRFNQALRKVLVHHQEIVDVILPTLGKDRAATYSPLMPLHPLTNKVMQVTILDIDVDAGFLTWKDDEGVTCETSVYNGRCKLQWKADWAMRWYALGVAYEMSGKDLIDSVTLSSKICRILGGTPPINLTYELFLDENGHKQSKSKGNGLSIDDWLRYGPPESLAHFIYANPQRAKKLYLGMIPRAMDDYLADRAKLASQTPAERNENPAWYVHGQSMPEGSAPVSFALLLNLAGVANTDDPEVLWGYVERYAPGTLRSLLMEQMISNAIAWYRDKIVPTKIYRAPTEIENQALLVLRDTLVGMQAGLSAEEIMTSVYAVGNQFFKPLKGWFDCLYQVLLGQTEGPRLGVFIALYGIENTVALIEQKITKA